MRSHDLSDKDRLLHIQDAVRFILSHTSGMGEEDFYRDEVLKRAVVRDLEIIGEAARLMSETVKQKHAEVPWRQMAATRHKMIHEYFHVNYKTVWEIVRNDLPVLDKRIDQILNEFS